MGKNQEELANIIRSIVPVNNEGCFIIGKETYYIIGGEKKDRVMERLFDGKGSIVGFINSFYFIDNNPVKRNGSVRYQLNNNIICNINGDAIQRIFDNEERFIAEIRNELGMFTIREKLLTIWGKNEQWNLENPKVKQVILTGAPGTGKTYNAEKIVNEIIAQEMGKNGENIKEENLDKIKEYYELVQFHPSYDYTDFMEGLKPVAINGQTSFVKIDGTFKKLCRRAAKDSEHPYFMIIDEINRADLSKVLGELMYGLEEDKRGSNHKFATQYNYLPTYDIEKKDNMSRDEDAFKDGFYVPENVYIIGTMNDIDRSVEAFDFALRRRFHWIEVSAAAEMKAALYTILNIEEKEEEEFNQLIRRINELNAYIDSEEGKKFGLSTAYQLGPAYFRGITFDNDGIINENSLNDTWNYKVKPILKEYLRGYNCDEVDKFILSCKESLYGNEQKNNGVEANER